MKNQIKELIYEGVLDYFKKKKSEEQIELKKYIKDRFISFRLHAVDPKDQVELMKFIKSLISDVEEKFGKICVPSVSKDQIEDLVGAYLDQYKMLK